MNPAYSSRFAQVNGIRLHYYLSVPASGGPAILMMHGITDNGICWVQVADALRERYDLVMPDMRGHGLSDKPEKGYHIDTLAADLAGLIDALGLDRPVIWGQSLGGLIVEAAAALYPDKIRCTVLEEPAWFPRDETPEERAARTKSWREEYGYYQSMRRDELIAYVHQEKPLWQSGILGPWADAKLQLKAEALIKIGDENRFGGWREYIPKIRCPVLLLAGDPARGAMVTQDFIQEAKRMWADGRVVHIPEAGHTIHQDQLEACVQAVSEFLGEMGL